MNDFVQSIDRQVAAKHLLTHPFYQAWTRGELTRDALSDYAKQYYHHVAAFPTYLSAAHSRCENQSTRRHLLHNLIDEEAGSPNHPELWLQFAESLGQTRADVIAAPQERETSKLISTFRAACSGETAEALGALYAYESQIPAVSETKIDGLKKHYGFDEPSGYEYFTVHVEADREHSATEREMLAQHANSQNAPRISAAVERVLDALWELLSGVCRRHAIAC